MAVIKMPTNIATPRRYRVIVRGNVIRVGYREFIRQVANQPDVDVKGIVRNKENFVEI